MCIRVIKEVLELNYLDEDFLCWIAENPVQIHGGGGECADPTPKFVRVGVPWWDVVDGHNRGPMAIITFFSSILFQARFARQLLHVYAQHFFILFTVTFKFNDRRALAYLTLRIFFQVIYSKHLSLYDKRHYMQHVILITFLEMTSTLCNVMRRHWH